MRSSPQVAVGGAVAAARSFGAELALTLLFNLVLTSGLIVLLNLTRVRDFPTGYTVPIVLGLVGGLISGTNSFAVSDLRLYNAWEGQALGLSIGGLEMLGYCLVAAATANLSMEVYRSWWRWSGEFKPTRIRTWRDLRLIRSEWLVLVLAVLLILLSAYRETLMAVAA